MNKKKQSGTILITTLLLLAVVTLIAIGLSERQRIDIRRTSKYLSAEKASYSVKITEMWAMQLLKTLPSNSHSVHTIFLSSWPKVMTPFSLPEGTIEAELYDAQGQFFNLNNLSSPLYREGFLHFLTILLPDQTRESDKMMTQAIASWIQPLGKDTDILSDQFYLSASPPYRAAHLFFVSPSELRLIKDITPSTYNQLVPYMISLPSVTKINVNTAPPMILTLIGNGLSLAEAKIIVAQRTKNGGFKTMGDFFSLPLIQQHHFSADQISLDSHYFLLKTTINFYHQTLTFFSLFQLIKTEDNSNQIIKLWQLRETL